MTGRRPLRAVVLVALLGFCVGIVSAMPIASVVQPDLPPASAAAIHDGGAPAGTSLGHLGAQDLGGPLAADGVERPGGRRAPARESGALSALAVLVLALIVGVTAVFGSRRSSR